MPLFTEDGRVVDRDALRSIQFRGQGFRQPRTQIVDDKKVTEVVHEDDGGTAGTTTEHASGRVDANVQARAAQITTKE